MSELPENWVETRLEDVGQIITGNTPTPKDPENYNGDIPFTSGASGS